MSIKKTKYILLFIFLIVVARIAIIPPIWGYDEYASVITHLELNDQRFIDIYLSYFNTKNNIFIEDFILPIFIVPIRWTYALGISPLYGLIRFIDLDWSYFRLIFLTFHAILSFIGLKMIFKVLHKYFDDKFILIFFISILFFSAPFLYWTLTLSPYSYHLFCFGMILYNETFDSDIGRRFFCRKSIRRAIVQIFNYQYIPIVVMIGCFDFIKHRRKFFSSNKYKEWIIPSLVSLGSFIFLILRVFLTKKHSNPTLSILQDGDASKYEIWSNSNSLIEFVKYVTSRMYDIINYFFQSTNYHLLLSKNYSSFNMFYSSIFIILILFISIILFKIRSRLITILLIILSTNFVLYLTEIYPFMPSRHSLISFLPFAVVCAIFLSTLTKQFNNKYFSYIFGFLFLFVSLFTLNKSFIIQSSPLNKEYLLTTLEQYNVDRLVLVPCDQEPLFYMKDLIKYKPLYQCGPMIIETLEGRSYRFGVYSKDKINYKEATKAIKPFFKKKNVKFTLVKQVNQNLIFQKIHIGDVSHTITIIDAKF